MTRPLARRWVAWGIGVGTLTLVLWLYKVGGLYNVASEATGEPKERPTQGDTVSSPSLQEEPELDRTTKKERAKADLRAAVLAAVPALHEASTDWDRAIILRNHVYAGSAIGKGPVSLPVTVESYRSVVTGQSPHLCAGLAAIYMGVLQAFDIPTRLVTVAADNLADTHATVEVFLNGQWVLQDPTFNVRWEVGNQPVGVEDLREAFLSGEEPHASTDGYALLPGRSLEEYYIPYRDLLTHVEVGHWEVLGPDAGTYQMVKTIPEGPTWRYRAQASPLVAPEDRGQLPIHEWDFSSGAPEGWGILPGSAVSPLDDSPGVVLVTDHSNNHYQLWSPEIDLHAGDYRVQLKGSAVEGGLGILLVDTATGSAVAGGLFWSEQWAAPTESAATVDFTLREGTKIQLILHNWSFEAAPSTWHLEELMILSRPSRGSEVQK